MAFSRLLIGTSLFPVAPREHSRPLYIKTNATPKWAQGDFQETDTQELHTASATKTV